MMRSDCRQLTGRDFRCDDFFAIPAVRHLELLAIAVSHFAQRISAGRIATSALSNVCRVAFCSCLTVMDGVEAPSKNHHFAQGGPGGKIQYQRPERSTAQYKINLILSTNVSENVRYGSKYFFMPLSLLPYFYSFILDFLFYWSASVLYRAKTGGKILVIPATSPT